MPPLRVHVAYLNTRHTHTWTSETLAKQRGTELSCVQCVPPVDRGEVNVVVGINLHEETSTYVTVEASNGKVWVVLHVLYPMWVLEREMEVNKHALVMRFTKQFTQPALSFFP